MPDDVLDRIDQLRALLATPAFRFETSYEALEATPEYEALVRIGPPALERLCDRLGEGDFFLNGAVLRIAGIRLADLGLASFPSERAVANALLELLTAQIFWTAVSSSPPPTHLVIQTQNPLMHIGTLNRSQLAPQLRREGAR